MSRKGLSILELLVALSVLSLIALGLAGSLQLGTRVWDRALALGEHDTELVLRTRLRGWIAEAYPPRRKADFETIFEGRPDRLEFHTLAEIPSVPETHGLSVLLALEDSMLVMEVRYLDVEGTVLKEEQRILTRNASSLRVRYFSGRRDTETWADTWISRQNLPALVRISLDPGSTPAWPDMIVEPIYRTRSRPDP